MATKSSKAIQPSNSTDAHFRAWPKFIYDTMIAGGWIQTADTGQINFATVTMPTAANQARGYIIMRMDDALQATVPVVVRLDFGSAAAINNMGLWITIGSASDGAGVISPAWMNSPTTSAATLQSGVASTTIVRPMCFGSAGTARVHCVWVLDIDSVSAGTALGFSLERTKASNGSDDATGVVLYYVPANNSWTRIQFMFAALGGVQPPAMTGLPHIHSLRTVSAATQNVGVGIPIPIERLAEQPVTGLLLGRTGDWTPGARIRVVLYAQTITYQGLFGLRITFEAQDSNAVVFMRFD